jgi:hypothetical protein
MKGTGKMIQWMDMFIWRDGASDKNFLKIAKDMDMAYIGWYVTIQMTDSGNLVKNIDIEWNSL